ncbi:MAG: hypothetical protein KKB50_04215 [Planctomycetes bacterium]|nr:hypothetical protein [Planctomycetota bacterium]
MSALVTRIILATTMIAVTPAAYMILYLVLFDTLFRPDEVALLAAAVVWATLFAVGWILVWRREVNWTRVRKYGTWGAAVAALIPAVPIGLLVGGTIAEELGMVTASVVWWVVWIVFTAYLWRERPAERASRLLGQEETTLHCPKCRYNLTGLREARCPECGTQFTLGELYAHQRQKRSDLGSD